MPIISVIVPIYNAEEFLNDCIKSLIKQTYKNIEIILINDGSTDSTLEICNRFKQKDSRIKVISQQNSGVSAARNKGIKVSQGDYITFVDADDLVTSNYCKTLLETIKTKKVDLAYFGQSSYQELSTDLITPRLSEGVYKAKEILPIILDDGTLTGFLLHSSCAVLYNAEIIKENNLKFDPNIKYNEDGFFNLNYCLYADNIYVNQQESIYLYRENRKLISSKFTSIEGKYTHLHSQISKLNELYPIYQFDKQLSKRHLTLVLEELMNPVLLRNSKIWFATANQLVKPLTKEYYTEFNLKDMSRSRRLIFHLIKSRKTAVLFLVLKYTRPLAKKMNLKD